jgi:hypothetical protein
LAHVAANKQTSVSTRFRLVGEHVEADSFRIVDISIQRRGGTASHFVRDPEHAKVFLADFFARTARYPRRCLY